MSTTKRQTPRLRALALADDLGVEIYFWTGKTRGPYSNGEWAVEYDVEAPHRFVWCATGSHTLTCGDRLEAGHPEAKPSRFWRMLADDLGYGLQPCFHDDCEWCESA